MKTTIFILARNQKQAKPISSALKKTCLSLKDKSMPNPDEFDEGGPVIDASVLFGDHEPMFMALMLERLHRDKLDPETYLHKMTRAHFNRGVIALGPRLNDLSNFYELVKEEKN